MASVTSNPACALNQSGSLPNLFIEPTLHEVHRFNFVEWQSEESCLQETAKKQAVSSISMPNIHTFTHVKQIDEEKVSLKCTPQSSTKHSYFITDKCVPAAETVEHLKWMHSDRVSKGIRKRGSILYESLFPDTFRGLFAARFSSNGDYLATGYGSGAVQVRSGIDGNLLFDVYPGINKTSPVKSIRFHPVKRNYFFTARADGRVLCGNTNEAACIHFCTEHHNEINTLDVNLTGELLATGGKDGAVRLYDIDTAEKLIKYAKNPIDFLTGRNDSFHHLHICSICFHPHMGHIFVSGGWDNKVEIWDIRDPEGCVRTIFGPKLCGDALDIKDINIITGSWAMRDSLQLWDLISGKLISTINPANSNSKIEGDFLFAAQFFSGDPHGDKVVIGGSGSHHVQIISLESKMVIYFLVIKKYSFTCKEL